MPTKLPRITQFGCIIEAEPNTKYQGMILELHEFMAIIMSWCESEGIRYWGILHDADLNEDGTRKRPHYHLVLETPTKHTTTGIVEALSSLLVIAPERVSVRKISAFNASLRYLTHNDDGDKTQYMPDEVFTNDQARLTYAYACKTEEFTIEELLIIIGECPDLVSIARKIGLKQYQRYRATIADMIKCLAHG